MRGLDSPVVLALYLICLVVLAQYAGLLVVCSCSAILVIFKWSRGVDDRRTEVYERLLQHTSSAPDQIGVETCQWMNALAERAWNTCLRRQIGPYLAVLQEHMENSTPGFIRSVTMEGMDVGTRPPHVEGVAVHAYLPDDLVQFTARFRFLPDANMRLTVGVPHISAGIPLLLHQFMMTGTARITVQLHPIAWRRSVVSLSLIGRPDIDFKVNLLGRVNGSRISGLYDWIREAIHTSIHPLLVWPQSMSMTLEGDYLPHHMLGRWAGPPGELLESSPAENLPIAEVGVVTANEETLPEGWEVLGRTVSGFFPADLNHGSADRELYICYRRVAPGEERPPINGICLIFPDLGEAPPPDFTVVQLTVGGADADLNTGGDAAYLAFSRGAEKPLTEVALFNETEENVKPRGYAVLELTPGGRTANLNKGKAADVLYVCYRGGTPSAFGFDYVVAPTSEKALLRVSAVGAVDLKAYDVGGACDAYCELYVSSLTSGKGEAAQLSHKQTSVAERATNPKWGETFVFRSCQSDLLNIVIYDKSRHVSPAKDYVLGVLKFPLDTLVRGVEVRAWYELQLVSQGQALVAVQALNFGLADSTFSGRPLPQIDASKLGSTVRKVRAMADKIIRTNIRTNIPTGIASKLPSGAVASARDATQLGAALLPTADGSPRSEEEESSTGAHPQLAASGEREAEADLANSGMLSSRGVRWHDEGSASPAQDLHHHHHHQQSQSGGSSSFVEKKGALEKRKGTKAGKKASYSKKWYVLHEGQLSHYRSQKDAAAARSPIGAIDLSDATVALEDHHVIRINTPSQELIMRAASEHEAQEWVNAVRHNVWLISPLSSSTSLPAPSSATDAA
mmetsp:Transcript_1594/g.5626  ORF Transcript_1594/g.5626 Transcript_1594/m.5626 type:complete len:852 (+) Transcript_1594:33-2588(+)